MYFFPLPQGLIIELESICVDTHLSNEQARAFRWNRLIWPFELYGVENYAEDLYVPGMSRSELPERIAKYGGEIGVAFSISSPRREAWRLYQLHLAV